MDVERIREQAKRIAELGRQLNERFGDNAFLKMYLAEIEKAQNEIDKAIGDNTSK